MVNLKNSTHAEGMIILGRGVMFLNGSGCFGYTERVQFGKPIPVNLCCYDDLFNSGFEFSQTVLDEIDYANTELISITILTSIKDIK